MKTQEIQIKYQTRHRCKANKKLFLRKEPSERREGTCRLLRSVNHYKEMGLLWGDSFFMLVVNVISLLADYVRQKSFSDEFQFHHKKSIYSGKF